MSKVDICLALIVAAVVSFALIVALRSYKSDDYEHCLKKGSPTECDAVKP